MAHMLGTIERWGAATCPNVPRAIGGSEQVSCSRSWRIEVAVMAVIGPDATKLCCGGGAQDRSCRSGTASAVQSYPRLLNLGPAAGHPRGAGRSRASHGATETRRHAML